MIGFAQVMIEIARAFLLPNQTNKADALPPRATLARLMVTAWMFSLFAWPS